jgi:hypothetical protein
LQAHRTTGAVVRVAGEGGAREACVPPDMCSQSLV